MASVEAIFYSACAAAAPAWLVSWGRGRSLEFVACGDGDDLMARALRGRPALVVFDARDHARAVLDASRRLKRDPYTAVVPAVTLVAQGERAIEEAFDAGADEVLSPSLPEAEGLLRLAVALRRAERDVRVHPSTRLPGAPEIEAEIARRLRSGERFATCYADLDHFKEYNDRYSYYEGDRVIRLLARLLHDVVRGHCPATGFVGHIGGDDFIFIVPRDMAERTSADIVEIFDSLVPYQYSEPDRNAGYYFGKDRRGQLHRVPLMTVSIGIVTNERRAFTHAAQVSELASEMKSYAKTLPGSVYVVDRRQEPLPDAPGGSVGR